MATEQEDKRLIKKYIDGCAINDRASQKSLYQHFYSFAMGICLRYADDRLDASGILNEGFFKVFNNISKYDHDKPFLPWLGRIITNTAIDHYRKNLKFTEHLDIADHQYIVDQRSVYDDLAYAELLKLVQQLSPAYRTVFNLFAIDGYGHEEIAELLKISVGTSKSNLFKARQKLQDMLSTAEPMAHSLNEIGRDGKHLEIKFNPSS